MSLAVPGWVAIGCFSIVPSLYCDVADEADSWDRSFSGSFFVISKHVTSFRIAYRKKTQMIEKSGQILNSSRIFVIKRWGLDQIWQWDIKEVDFFLKSILYKDSCNRKYTFILAKYVITRWTLLSRTFMRFLWIDFTVSVEMIRLLTFPSFLVMV